ncbi:MAG: type IV secretion system DNA-binding domain-containing protein [Candidatus Symbiodolus clandestinus]
MKNLLVLTSINFTISQYKPLPWFSSQAVVWCKRSEHFHSLAEALIPNEGRNVEDFFIKAVRAVLANIAERMSFVSTATEK